MKKLILLTIFSLSLLFGLQAQNKAVFTHYYISPILINPSVAGFFEQHQFQVNARAQWTGFPDAPKTLGAMYNGPIGNTFGLGVGVFTERAAQLSEVRAVLNYAFRFNIKEHVKLTAGFSTEFYQQRLSNDVLGSNLLDPNMDDLVDEAIDGRETLDASVGVFATIYENTFAGLTFANLVGQRLDNIAEDRESSFFKHYAFLVGHRIDIFDLNFNIEPSMLIRQVQNAPFQVDFNVKAGFLEDQLLAGLSYRTLGSLGVLLGTKLSNFQLYYSYDASFQQFQKYNSGSHEVTVALYFDRKNKKNPYVQ